MLVVIYRQQERTNKKGYTMKDYMKRETFAHDDGWPWRDIDYGGYSLPRYNEQKRKTKRRCRHRMKQRLNKELREYM